MKIFVAGATGVLGRRAVARLVAAGHEVTGIARGPAKAALLAGIGATPVEVSLFEPEALHAAVAGHDAVVNLATHIPPLNRAARLDAWAENDRIRSVGSRNLVDAALSAGARIYVQESIAFLYGEHGDTLLDEDVPLDDSMFTTAVREAEANTSRFSAADGRGVVLRFGRFYSHDGRHARAQLPAARLGLALDVGRPDAYLPVISADDAARAVVAALEAPAGVFNVVDDVPLTHRQKDDALAQALGRKRLRRPPEWLTRVGVPRGPLNMSQRVANHRFREATGWSPSSPSMREGWPSIVRRAKVAPALSLVTRVLLWLLAFNGVAVGMQALFTPRAFYDDFPFGRAWVAADGAYNEHLVRDVGAFNLALALVALGAIAYATPAIARISAGGWLVYSVPHFVYHLLHLEGLATSDQWSVAISLGFSVALAVALLGVAGREPRRSTG